MAIPNQRKARRPTIVVSNASLKTSISWAPLFSHGSGISSGNASTASFRPQTGLSTGSHQSNSAPPAPIVSTSMPLIVVPPLSAEPQQCYSTPFRMSTYEKQGDGGVMRLTRSPTRKFVLRSTATKGLLTLHTRRNAPGVPAPAQSWNDRRQATAGSGPAGKDLSTQALTPLRLSAHPVSRILESFRSSPRWRYGATVST